MRISDWSSDVCSSDLMITNHLVAVHNVATAEALSLALLSGLDLHMVHELIAGGPASSEIFGFRGPMMIEGRYDTPTMRLDVFQKDLDKSGRASCRERVCQYV